MNERFTLSLFCVALLSLMANATLVRKNYKLQRQLTTQQEVSYIMRSASVDATTNQLLTQINTLERQLVRLRSAFEISDSLYQTKVKKNKKLQSTHQISAALPVSMPKVTPPPTPKKRAVHGSGKYKRSVGHRTRDLAYIERFKETAISEMNKFGIPASIKLAQGIIESNAGRSTLSTYNNHFGIKYSSKSFFYKTALKDMILPKIAYLKDDCCALQGKPSNCDCRDKFFVFDRPWASYRAHSLLLTSKSRYDPCFKLSRTDYAGWAHQLKKSGYATSKVYASVLIDVIEQYELYQYDN